jgi:t-SNARE complex subunit (syntaxin)
MLKNELLKNNDLDKIEKDIIDLNEIQQTINELVILQGKNITNLEYHINNTLVDIDNGYEELNHTSIIQDKIMIKKNILTGIGIVGLTVITTPIIGIPLALSISLGSILTYKVIFELNK